MVRHEAAEALGGIATPEVLPHLKEWVARDDAPVVVRESCQVALDMWEVSSILRSVEEDIHRSSLSVVRKFRRFSICERFGKHVDADFRSLIIGVVSDNVSCSLMSVCVARFLSASAISQKTLSLLPCMPFSIQMR